MDGAAAVTVCAAAVVTVCAAGTVVFDVGLAVAASLPVAGATGLLVAVTSVDDEEEEPAAAAMPMTNTSPQNARNPVSALCLAAQGFRRCGPYPCCGCWP